MDLKKNIFSSFSYYKPFQILLIILLLLELTTYFNGDFSFFFYHIFILYLLILYLLILYLFIPYLFIPYFLLLLLLKLQNRNHHQSFLDIYFYKFWYLFTLMIFSFLYPLNVKKELVLFSSPSFSSHLFLTYVHRYPSFHLIFT